MTFKNLINFLKDSILLITIFYLNKQDYNRLREWINNLSLISQLTKRFVENKRHLNMTVKVALFLLIILQ